MIQIDACSKVMFDYNYKKICNQNCLYAVSHNNF